MVKYSKKQNVYLDQMFGALSDEKRRQILEKVTKAKRLTVSEIAKPYVREKVMSFPAVSKHIKILGQSNLIRIEAKGRTKIVMANPDAVKWLGNFFNFYNKKLDGVEKYLKETTP